MIIISNDCSCYSFYDKMGKEYNHPFIGNRQLTEDFINTVKYFKDIDYLNYTTEATERFSHISGIRPHLKVIIDNKVNVNFIHYWFVDQSAEYKYIRRAERLNNIKLTDDNIIFICNETGSCKNCFEELKKICIENNYKLIYCEDQNKEKLSFTEEKIDKNILQINRRFRPEEVHIYVEKYNEWLLASNNEVNNNIF